MAATVTALNPDYERRPYWHATMPVLPDRAGRDLPDRADVVVVGGGYTGIAAARRLAGSGAKVTLLEANNLGWGASTRNGGLIHAGYKWGPKALIKRYGEETGRALYRETLEAYAFTTGIAREEGIDCELRESGTVELAYAPSHVPDLHEAQKSLAFVGVESTVVPRERLREEIGSDVYYGGLSVEGSGILHPGKWFAGLAASAERAGADLHEGVRARRLRRRGTSLVVETDRGRIAADQVLVATNGYTDAFVPALRRRLIPIGSYIIATEPLPADLVAELSPKGRAFVDSKNFLYYWHVSADRRMIFGGRASFIPTSAERTAAILHRGLLDVHPQLAGYRIDYAWGGNVGFTLDRMPHVGQMSGVTYAMGYCGTGVAMSTWLGTRAAEWMGGGEPPALARLRFPLVPAPYEGRPWFLPFAGEWFRLQDRLAARSRPKD